MKFARPIHDALKLKLQSQAVHISAGKFDSYLFLIQKCTSIRQLKQIHAHICLAGTVQQNLNLVSKLVISYVMLGCMRSAQLLFDKIKICEKDSWTWNSMIRGYAEAGNYGESIKIYRQMENLGVKSDTFTFNFVLKACSALSDISEGRRIHDQVVMAGFESDLFVGNALISFYCKCRQLESARQVFDTMPAKDIVSWNGIISGYAVHGPFEEAIFLFRRMKDYGKEPDSFTYNFVLKACAETLDLEQGSRIHAEVEMRGFGSVVFVGNSLINMYSKCGDVENASEVFDKMRSRDVVSWNAMIGGYTQNGHFMEALDLFNQMRLKGIRTSVVTMSSVMQAIAGFAALQQAKWVHGYIIQSGFEFDICVASALIDLYAKCGSVDIAREVFDRMLHKNVVSWSSMIDGYGMYGKGAEALEVFENMLQLQVEPDHVTFLCVLSACNHAGLVEEGCHYFDCMILQHKIAPRVEHYSCMVDLLGRAGKLNEAQEFIKNMPMKPCSKVWGALLGACSIHGNIELAEQAAKIVFESDPENAGRYVILSNIFAAAGRWEDVIKVRDLMRKRKVKKKPGCSFIEVNNKVHEFLVGDVSHPESEKIYAMLGMLYMQMKNKGYVPDTKFVFHDVEEEVKADLLGSHSEKLAIAFGLISTPPGTPIRITKNLRICGDCHTATKFISEIVDREIIIRDASRFHVFKDGSCSCRDYW